MKNYTLDASGVQEWQTDVYASSEASQAHERISIRNNFSQWLAHRFGATTSQLAFLDSLQPDFMELLRDELVLSLRAKIEIRFEKGERPTLASNKLDDMGDSEKIIRIRKWLEEQDTGEEPELPEEPKQPEKPESPTNPANPAKVEDSMHSPHKVCTHCNSENKHLKSYLLIQTHYIDK